MRVINVFSSFVTRLFRLNVFVQADYRTFSNYIVKDVVFVCFMFRFRFGNRIWHGFTTWHFPAYTNWDIRDAETQYFPDHTNTANRSHTCFNGNRYSTRNKAGNTNGLCREYRFSSYTVLCDTSSWDY